MCGGVERVDLPHYRDAVLLLHFEKEEAKDGRRGGGGGVI